MKFKTKEELLKEGCGHGGCNCYDTGIERAFKSFSDRVEFYKKYKWKGGDSFKRLIEDVLYREQLKVYIKWMDYKKETIEQYAHDISKAKESGVEGYAESLYNDWLLDYCFGDVIE